MKRGSDDLAARAAALYYIEQATQADIAARLGVSRPTVGRLLRHARDTGIVTITVHSPPGFELELGAEAVRRFGIRHALIAPDNADPDVQRRVVAQAASDYLLRHLRAGMTVAVGMGRNTAAVAECVRDAPSRPCTFVAAIGGSPGMAPGVEAADICRAMADRFGGSAIRLYAPAYADTPDTREAFMAHDDVRRALRQAANADMAVVGIGDADDESAVVRMGCFSRADMTRLRSAGAVGDILGSFFDIHGRPVAAGMRDRVISIGAEDIKRIPCVIAVASEAGKAHAILGALRSGMVKVLATSASNVREAMRLEEDTA